MAPSLARVLYAFGPAGRGANDGGQKPMQLLHIACEWQPLPVVFLLRLAVCNIQTPSRVAGAELHRAQPISSTSQHDPTDDHARAKALAPRDGTCLYTYKRGATAVVLIANCPTPPSTFFRNQAVNPPTPPRNSGREPLLWIWRGSARSARVRRSHSPALPRQHSHGIARRGLLRRRFLCSRCCRSACDGT